MSITFTEYRSALRENYRKPIFKVEWLDSSEVIVDEITNDIITGDINVSLENGIRRDCKLTLANNLQNYNPNSDGKIYIDKKFKLYTGLEINGEEYFNSQGIFNIGNPELSVDIASNYVKIEGFDNFALLNGTIQGKLLDNYIIPVGTTITEAVKSIVTISALPKSPIVIPSTEVLPYTLVKETGSNLGELLQEMAKILSWVVYIDTDGRLRFEPPVDEQNTEALETLSENEVSLSSYNHKYQYYDIKNYIKVIGDNINGDIATGIAQDTGIFSPTSVSRIGERAELINDSNIYSDELAQDRADYELKKAIQLYESCDLKIIPKDYLDVGDLINIDHPGGGFNRDKCLIKHMNIPLKYNEYQNLTVWKVREV